MDTKTLPKKLPSESIAIFLKRSFSHKDLNVLGIGLLALLTYSVITKGFNPILIYLFALLGALPFELGFAKLRKRVVDLAWWFTPLLFTMLTPPTLSPLWMASVGGAVSALYGKLVFGGHGKYPFLPAAVGMVFLSVSFSTYMVVVGNTAADLKSITDGFSFDVVELLVGPTPGFIGDPFRLGILLLGFVFAFLKVIDLRITLSYLLGVVGFVALFWWLESMNPTLFAAARKFPEPTYVALVGTVVFASVFLLTDKTTAPRNNLAKIVYGLFAGLITIVIRYFTGWEEGVIYAVLLANAFSPLIDAWISKKAIPLTVGGK
jgi:Na+-translocating ferredoxin:NAD+ oxidoreductase RnfD subunit